MSRRVILWRHGQTTHNATGRWQGQLDTDLSEVGRQQAEVAAAMLLKLAPSVLWTSDLRRAVDTAQVLARLTGVPPVLDARLREIDVGQWQGLSAGEVAEQYPELHERLGRGEDFARGVTGESVAELVERGRPALAEVVAQLPAQGCAVVTTHGVSARSLAADLVGIDQAVAWRALGGLANCHWIELAEHRLGWRIEGWNKGVQ